MDRLDVPIDVGQGPVVVILCGFAMRPSTYGRLVDLLATRCRVVVPDLFDVRGPWQYPKVLDAFTAALDHLGLDRITLLGHSFGGGIELGFASRCPERTVELVFSDTLAASREWRLADEAGRHPGRLVRLATPRAMGAFLRTWTLHPHQMVGAAWWGFTSTRQTDSECVARDGIPAHVLWANRDSIIPRVEGERFAKELGATFTVASTPDRQALDHDWMFEQPDVFFDHLVGLGLIALSSRGRAPRMRR